MPDSKSNLTTHDKIKNDNQKKVNNINGSEEEQMENIYAV